MKPYFSHDIFARENLKIKRLMNKHKMEGYGIFWALAEFLHYNSNKIDISEIDLLASDMGVEKEKLESVIYDFNLFTVRKNTISSKRVAQNLKLQKEKSQKARESAMRRWKAQGSDRSIKEPDADALQTDCERNAINKKKKEKKENENKENKKKKESDENFYGVLKNVFLSPSNFSSLSVQCADDSLFHTIVDELSENIALKKEKPYELECPDLHFLRLQKYLKQKLTTSQKKNTSAVSSVKKTTDYLEQIKHEEGVPPPAEFFRSKENLLKKIMEEKNNADR